MTKSNQKTPFDEIPNDQKLTMSKMMVAHSSEKVDAIIDKLTSASLKRVLKIVSHVHFADALLDKQSNINLNPTEQDLIDSIFSLQETVFGHQALVQELKGEEENPENSGLEQVNLTTDLKGESNE